MPDELEFVKNERGIFITVFRSEMLIPGQSGQPDHNIQVSMTTGGIVFAENKQGVFEW